MAIELGDAFERLVSRTIAEHHRRIEAACWEMLADGHRGVLVCGDTVTLDERVPFAHIYDITACPDWDGS